jgi:hypothetical protein
MLELNIFKSSGIMHFKKWRQLSSVGAILLFMSLTSVYSNSFVDDLIRLSQINREFATQNLTLSFL